MLSSSTETPDRRRRNMICCVTKFPDYFGEELKDKLRIALEQQITKIEDLSLGINVEYNTGIRSGYGQPEIAKVYRVQPTPTFVCSDSNLLTVYRCFEEWAQLCAENSIGGVLKEGVSILLFEPDASYASVVTACEINDIQVLRVFSPAGRDIATANEERTACVQFEGKTIVNHDVIMKAIAELAKMNKGAFTSIE